MKIIYSDRCLEYKQSGHPESPGRVREACEFLKGKNFEFLEPEPIKEEYISKVHSKEYVEKVKNLNLSDPDTPNYENIFEYARLSAGGAIKALEENSFSLMRPPGHHTGINGKALEASSLGFCYFNNIAIAIKNKLPNKNVLVVDIDAHHGNGSQEIFEADESVVYLSLHRSPWYPGTGLKSEDNIINIPLNFDTGNEKYIKSLKKGLENALNLKEPDLIGISAGFDGNKGDLASLSLSGKCYKEIGEIISELGKPTFSILEGGYEYGKTPLGERIFNFLEGLES